MNPLGIAFQHSQATRPALFPDIELFVSLLEAGFSVVLCHSTRYCGVTDAQLPGNDTCIIAAFPTRDRAIEYWFTHKLYENISDIDYEVRHPIHQVEELTHVGPSRPVVERVCFVNGSPFHEPELCIWRSTPGFNSNGYVIAYSSDRDSTTSTLFYDGNEWSSDRNLAVIYEEQQHAYVVALDLAYKGTHCQIWSVSGSRSVSSTKETSPDDSLDISF
jgi:hypothetical protein